MSDYHWISNRSLNNSVYFLYREFRQFFPEISRKFHFGWFQASQQGSYQSLSWYLVFCRLFFVFDQKKWTDPCWYEKLISLWSHLIHCISEMLVPKTCTYWIFGGWQRFLTREWTWALQPDFGMLGWYLWVF